MKKISKIYMLFLILSLGVFFSLNAFAYLDPSVVTYVIQIIAGVVIAGGAVFVILWRKAKKKVAKTLNIDENKNKVKEEDIVINEEESSDKQEESSEKQEEDKSKEQA